MNFVCVKFSFTSKVGHRIRGALRVWKVLIVKGIVGMNTTIPIHSSNPRPGALSHSHDFGPQLLLDEIPVAAAHRLPDTMDSLTRYKVHKHDCVVTLPGHFTKHGGFETQGAGSMEQHSGLARKDFRLLDQRFSIISQTLPERLLARLVRTHGQERSFLDDLRKMQSLCNRDCLCFMMWWAGHALIDLT